MKKLLAIMALAILVSPISAGATNVDDCGEVFTYTNQVNDSRVEIDTYNTGAQGNPDSIKIEAETGYEVISYSLELDDNNTVGWDVTGSGNANFNPTGTDIEQFEVKVKKVCTDICTDPEATNYDSELGEFEQSNNTVCVYPEPVDVCANIEGNQETMPEGLVHDGANCVEPTTTPTPVPPPSPAPQPAPQSSGGSQGGINWCDQPGEVDFCRPLSQHPAYQNGGFGASAPELSQEEINIISKILDLISQQIYLLFGVKA